MSDLPNEPASEPTLDGATTHVDEPEVVEAPPAPEEVERTPLEKFMETGDASCITSPADLYCDDVNRPVTWGVINALLAALGHAKPAEPTPYTGEAEDASE